MQPVGPLKFLFVINPVSGGKSKHSWKDSITQYFDSKPHAIHFFELSGKNDADSLSEKITTLKPHRVIAVGGDGTVNLVARKLLGTDIIMGVLPAGSANGFAKELGLPHAQEASLALVENGIIKKLDVLHINNECISLHLADLGLNAQLIKYFEESNWRGKLGYAKVLFKTLWRTQRVRALIETDTQTISRRAYMVVLANSRTYGTGAVINPIGKLNDGKFEVIVIRKLAFSELLKMIFQHKTYDPRKVEILRTSTVSIKTSRKIYFQADGEYMGKKELVTAQIIPGKLNLLTSGESDGIK